MNYKKQGVKAVRRNLGIAVDEILLVTFMAGSLGTFGAVVVPWEDISLSGSPQAQASAILTDIESANTAYKKLYNAWPHQMTNGDSSHNMVVLMSRQALRYPYSTMSEFKPVLPTLKSDLTHDGIVIKHGLSNGKITQKAAPKLSGYAIEITLENIALETAQRIDLAFDGEQNKKGDRVTVKRNGQLAHVTFKANKI